MFECKCLLKSYCFLEIRCQFRQNSTIEMNYYYLCVANVFHAHDFKVLLLSNTVSIVRISLFLLYTELQYFLTVVTSSQLKVMVFSKQNQFSN